MKTIKSILSFAMVTVLVGFASCSKTNPADQFADELNKLTKEISSVTNADEYVKIQNGIQDADKIITENADYELTDKDRETIKDAMKKFFTATFNKIGELQNQEMPEGQVDFMVNMIVGAVDQAKTLGDLNEPMMGSEPDAADIDIDDNGESIEINENAASEAQVAQD